MRHLFNKEIKSWSKKYLDVEAFYDFSSRSRNETQKNKGLNDDDHSVMQASVTLHFKVIAVQGKMDPSRITEDNKQVQDMNAPD